MKILHVHKYYHARDGAGRYEFDLMSLLESAGHTTAALAMEDPRNAPSAWKKYFVSTLDTAGIGQGSNLIKQFTRAFWSREAKQKMEAMLDAFRPDVVHAHNIYTHLSPAVLEPCRKRGIPVVMTVHDYGLLSANYVLWTAKGALPVKQSGLFKVAGTRFIKDSFLATLTLEVIVRLQRALGLVDRAVTRYLPVSDFVKNTLVAFGYNEKKITVVSPAVPHELFENVPPVGNREHAVLYAGRLDGYKGTLELLQAAALLPDVTFYLAGTGPLEKEVTAFAAEHPNVQYLGFVPARELWERMARVKVMVMPSTCYETLGLSVLEALFIGTPAVVSDIGGLSELVKKSGAGRLAIPGDPASLASAISVVIDSPEYEVMSKLGQEYARKNHSPEAFLKHILSVYEEVKHADTLS